MRFFPVKIKQLFLFRKLKQDNGYIKKEIQAVSIPKYYLDFAEYNEGKLDKIAIFFMNLKNMYNRFFVMESMIWDILFSFSPSWSFYQMKVPGFVGKISLRIQGLCVYNEYIVKDGIFS